MAKYYQRKDGLYETTRTINGKRVRFRGRTCRDVDRKILEYKEDKAHGRKFSIIAKYWAEEELAKMKPHTKKSYETALKDLLSEFGNRRADDIKAIDIIRYLESLKRKGYGKSSILVRKSVLSSVLQYAISVGDLETNPCRDASLPRNMESGTRRALTEDEEYLVESYNGEDAWIGMLMLYTGMRMSEIIALNYDDFDWQNGVIHVTKKYNNGTEGNIDNYLKSKNGKRDVPIFSALSDVMPHNRIGKLFPRENGDGYINADGFYKIFRNYKKNSGLPDDITPHCFRHSFMTICFESGISFVDAAGFLGDTKEVAMRVYTELRSNHHNESADQVNAYLEMRKQSRAMQA